MCVCVCTCRGVLSTMCTQDSTGHPPYQWDLYSCDFWSCSDSVAKYSDLIPHPPIKLSRRLFSSLSPSLLFIPSPLSITNLSSAVVFHHRPLALNPSSVQFLPGDLTMHLSSSCLPSSLLPFFSLQWTKQALVVNLSQRFYNTDHDHKVGLYLASALMDSSKVVAGWGAVSTGSRPPAF